MPKTTELTYSEIYEQFQIDPDRSWGFFFGKNDKEEFLVYRVVEPSEETLEKKFPIDVELGLFAVLEDAPNGFLPSIDGTFILKDKVILKDIDLFYFPSVDDLPEEDKMVDVSNPFDILKQLDQFSLAKKTVLDQIDDLDLDSEEYEEFRDLLDDFYYEYLTQFMISTRTLIMIRQYQMMTQQLKTLGEKPNKAITQWVN